MKVKTEQFLQTARAELKNETTRKFLEVFPQTLGGLRNRAFSLLPNPREILDHSAAIRAEVIDRLPDLLETFEKNAQANGARVFWAGDADQANDYIIGLARDRGVPYISKGKSMVTEEMGLNQALEKAGIDVWETDLGEFITQLLGLPPFHIIGPAINVPVEQIRDVFMEKAGMTEPTTDPVELGQAARRFLREKFHHLRMGVTGVNIAVAETGTIFNVENEGNIRYCKSSPQIQVSIMTLEKVAPTMADATFLLWSLCLSSTGQGLGSYVTMDSGPRKPGELDGPEELHIIILDNGRSDLYQDPVVREALRCMRCGACLNFCPVYGQIGGYPYGWAYSGPMGQILNPLLLGLDITPDLYRACTLCQKCKTVCPAGINHTDLMRYYRMKDAAGDREMKGRGAPLPDKALHRLYALTADNPGLWTVLSRWLNLSANIFEKDGKIDHLPGTAKGWSSLRDLPPFPAKTFHRRWKEMERGGKGEGSK